jgi:hypothetical protein
MDITTAIGEYEAATKEFLAVVNALTDAQLDRRNGESWSPRQVIHHVADSEAQSYARLRRLIVEPGTQIQSYNEGAWGEHATLGYAELPIEISINVFTAVRASSLEILKRLTPQQLNNSGIHSESGEYSIKTWLETYIKHPSEHADQIKIGL